MLTLKEPINLVQLISFWGKGETRPTTQKCEDNLRSINPTTSSNINIYSQNSVAPSTFVTEVLDENTPGDLFVLELSSLVEQPLKSNNDGINSK